MPRKNQQKGACGRPQWGGKDEAAVVAKLSEIWRIGGSDAEAAFYADISPSSLSRYLEKHPEVSQRKEALKNHPILLARRAVIGAFDGHECVTGKGKNRKVCYAPVDPYMALKYLERVRREEFSLRTEHAGANAPRLTGATVHMYIPHNNRDPLLAQPLEKLNTQLLEDRNHGKTADEH
ncbi:MAG: hypothetical protein A2270_03015 [Elusimicrobia bacterium RIFOXYA12_FULL_51_18]|nr:MAG: hypothetical protein A2270_03015 [Elusimicrobia bacterium RIFOXYA12_FULL_51_18]OGS28383.1 MAG: hypothetical protein A2218_06875 [Elusimicrobia bacterium RIFOXYA2_FULL_53_38]